MRMPCCNRCPGDSAECPYATEVGCVEVEEVCCLCGGALEETDLTTGCVCRFCREDEDERSREEDGRVNQ